jgi:hypothetical protein
MNCGGMTAGLVADRVAEDGKIFSLRILFGIHLMISLHAISVTGKVVFFIAPTRTAKIM